MCLQKLQRSPEDHRTSQYSSASLVHEDDCCARRRRRVDRIMTGWWSPFSSGPGSYSGMWPPAKQRWWPWWSWRALTQQQAMAIGRSSGRQGRGEILEEDLEVNDRSPGGEEEDLVRKEEGRRHPSRTGCEKEELVGKEEGILVEQGRERARLPGLCALQEINRLQKIFTSLNYVALHATIL